MRLVFSEVKFTFSSIITIYVPSRINMTYFTRDSDTFLFVFKLVKMQNIEG